jgi:glutathione peroxidase
MKHARHGAERRIIPARATWGTAVLALAALLASPAGQAQGSPAKRAAAAPAACPPLLDVTAARLQDGKPQHLCQHAGKVLLVVNTASYCGFTSQFEGLEALNARYAARGLVVLGFPSNDFRQEDADAKKTADVCFNTYGVKFPMFASGPVRGGDAQPLFRQLAAATGKQPGWNFNKYLVGRDGVPIAHFGSTVGPTSSTLTAAVEQALAAPSPGAPR